MDDGLEVRPNEAASIPQHYEPQFTNEKEVSRPWRMNGANEKTAYSALNATDASHESTARPWRVCGMAASTIGILAALLLALLVGGAVGGGLGSALAKARDQCRNDTNTTTIPTTTASNSSASNSSASSTTTGGLFVNYTVVPPAQIDTVPVACPGLDGSSYTSTTGEVFTLSCTNGYGGDDRMSLLAYTYQDCLNACSNVNLWSHTTEYYRVQFSKYVSFSMGSGCQVCHGNCWLKGNNAAVSTESTEGLSAVLL